MMGVLGKKTPSISASLSSGWCYEVKQKSENPSLTHGAKIKFKLEIYSVHKPCLNPFSERPPPFPVIDYALEISRAAGVKFGPGTTEDAAK